jgi:hypothetical protein
MPPLSASDEVISLLREASLPLPAHRRPEFLERISALLSNDEILIPARVMAAIARVQNEFLILCAKPDTIGPSNCYTALGPLPSCRSSYSIRHRITH